MADRETWCGNHLPHPTHDTCRSVKEPIIDGVSDATLCVVINRENHSGHLARTAYGPTYQPFAVALADAMNRRWNSIAWLAVPVAECADLCGNLNPHPGHSDCAGLTVPGGRFTGETVVDGGGKTWRRWRWAEETGT